MARKRKSGLVVPGVEERSDVLDTPAATLALFAYSGVLPDTVDCLLRDLRLWPNIVYYRISNDALISRSRSRAASDFLQSNREMTGDVLLMVDHDIKWDEGDLVYLAEKTLETKGIVAGIYSKREFGGGTAVRFSAPGKYTAGEDVLAEAQFVSTGFLGIHRSVLEKMSETLPKTIGNFWPFFLPLLATHPVDADAVEYLSEDWAFCARARELGASIHAALKPNLVHVGEWAYRLVDSQLTPAPDQGVTFSIAPEIEAPAIKWLLRDVAAYTEIPPDGLHMAMTAGTRGLATLWHKHGSSDPEGETAWYKREDVGKHYVLDLAYWHSTQLAPILAANLGDVEGQRVLDFGSGIGTAALMLAMQGNQVDCVEINKELRKFTEYRMGKHLNGKKAMRFISGNTLPIKTYDMVIAVDVFEHLPDPRSKLIQLAAALKPGGQMFTHSTFKADALHPMHHETEMDWEKELLDAGLRPVKDKQFMYEKIA
ncbi:hypothetical protein LCGC14_0843010 [marine sediment metagenome]|uniref:Methyltransferase type 11 domain-containing protein n=1 Tax=marine sediment metagenome TaxID=412755 RepID=A0A0F9SJQ6_9ZZZZ